MRALVWFRADLRVGDNPALFNACREADRGVVAVFLLAHAQYRDHDWGPPKADFVRRSVASLSTELASLGIPLLLRDAPHFRDAPAALLSLARTLECDVVAFNEEYEVNERLRDEAVVRVFSEAGLRCVTYPDQCVVPPGEVCARDGGFYSVYTPFRTAWLAHLEREGAAPPLPAPARRGGLVCPPDPVPAELPGFTPGPGIPRLWPAGEEEARRRLVRFATERLRHYAEWRDQPGCNATSRLSPYLAAGVISARQCLAACVEAAGGLAPLAAIDSGPATWASELIWREFYRHVMVGFPRVSMGRAFRLATERVAWRFDGAHFAAWCEGRTGYPLVDAAMRELAATGWMHNRARMVVAMFLTKHLLIDWRRGERLFMQSLVDADLANNNGGWQWAASTGTDAVPYFRIFNPVTQSRRFDPEGAYLRRWLPELESVPAAALHDPSSLPPAERRGLDYPPPIVDHARARERAIAAFAAVRAG